MFFTLFSPFRHCLRPSWTIWLADFCRHFFAFIRLCYPPDAWALLYFDAKRNLWCEKNASSRNLRAFTFLPTKRASREYCYWFHSMRTVEYANIYQARRRWTLAAKDFISVVLEETAIVHLELYRFCGAITIYSHLKQSGCSRLNILMLSRRCPCPSPSSFRNFILRHQNCIRINNGRNRKPNNANWIAIIVSNNNKIDVLRRRIKKMPLAHSREIESIKEKPQGKQVTNNLQGRRHLIEKSKENIEKEREK